MTAFGWCALGTACLLAAPGHGSLVRTAGLAGTGRLAAPVRQPGGAGRRRPWLAGGCAAGVAAVVAVWIGFGAALAAASTLGLVAGTAIVRRSVRTRVAWRADARLGDALRLVLAELQAGARLEQALRAAAEVDPDPAWPRAAHAEAAGGDPAEALIGGGRAAGVGHACRVARRSGAPLTDILDRLAADHATATEQRRTVRSALAGAHSSAAVLAVLPVVGVGLGTAMGAHPVTTLLHTGPGHLLSLLGVALDVAGVLWTARIVSSAERS